MAKKEKKVKDPNKKSLWQEFKEFINKGNAFMLAVGVVIGGAFNAIVTALVNILMSVATWGVPGGLKGLVTVLPALSESQKGVTGIGQTFDKSEIVEKTIALAQSQGVTITKDSDTFIQWQNKLTSLYTLHGTTYTYVNSAVIDWGTFINAIIAFIIIALTLFIIVKVTTVLSKRSQEAKARLEAKIKAEKKEEAEEGEKSEEEAPKEEAKK